MITRDQQRAKHAYEKIEAAAKAQGSFRSYKVLINSLGPNIMRSGLSGALAFVQRYKPEDVRERFGKDLAAGFPSDIDVGETLDDMVAKVQRMDLDVYMLATRECLRLTQWFKRAAQAQG